MSCNNESNFFQVTCNGVMAGPTLHVTWKEMIAIWSIINRSTQYVHVLNLAILTHISQAITTS